jgi:hypothetical protein
MQITMAIFPHHACGLNQMTASDEIKKARGDTPQDVTKLLNL